MGAYFTDRQGETRWIDDDDEYKRLNDAEYGDKGTSSESKSESKASGDGDSDAVKKADKQIAENEKLLNSEFAKKTMSGDTLFGKVPDKWSDVGSQIRQGFAKGVQKVAPTDKRAQAIEKRQALIEKNKEDDPFLDTEAPKALYRAPQSAIDGLVGLTQQAFAEGWLDGEYQNYKTNQILGTEDPFEGTILEHTKKDFERFERYKTNAEEIRKTGRLNGNVLGWQKDWLIPQLSKDSDFYKRYKPESEVVDLTAQIGGAWIGGGLIRGALKKLGLIRTGVAANQTTKANAILKGTPLGNELVKQVPKNRVLSYVRVFASEFGEEALFFPPDVPDLTDSQQEWVTKFKEAASPEAKLHLRKMYLSETNDEYNYHKTQLQQALLGASIVGGIKGGWDVMSHSFDIGWTAIRNIKLGKDPQKAVEEAYKKFEPNVKESLENQVNDIVQQELNLDIGKTTSDFESSVGKDIPEIAVKSREAGENYLSKTKQALEDQAEITKDVDIDADSLLTQKEALNDELKNLKKELKVSSQASITAKTRLLDERSVAYTKAQKDDPGWLTKGKGARGASKNESRVRELNKAINKMKRLEEVEIKLEELEIKEQELLASNTYYRNAETARLEASNEFQQVVTDLQEKVTKEGEILDARSKAVEMNDANQARLGEIVEPDDFGLSGSSVLHGEIKALLEEAQAAIDNGQLNPEFMGDWVRRVEEVNAKAVEEGVSAAPIKVGGIKEVEPEGLLAPKEEVPTIPVPVDKDGLVDSKRINQGVSLSEEVPINKVRQTENALESIQESLGVSQPAKTIKALENIGDEVDQLIDKVDAAKKFDAEHGTNTLEQELEIFRAANATTYTADVTDQALLKVVDNRIVNNKGINGILSKSLLELGQFIDDPRGVRQLSYLAQEGMLNRKAVKALSKIPVNLALLDANVRNAMSSLRLFKDIKDGKSKVTTLENATALALSDIKFLKASVRAVDPSAQYLGTGLGLFRKKLRLKFPSRAEITNALGGLNPWDEAGKQKSKAYQKAKWELLATEWNTVISNLPDPDELFDQMSHAGKQASQSFEETMGNTLKKLEKGEPISGEEFAKAMSIMDAVYKTGGNWNKIKEIDKTWSGVLNQIITSGTMSNPAGPLGIVVSGFSTAIPSHISGYVMGNITAKLARFAGREELIEGAAKEADLQHKWLKGYLYGIMNSWEGFSNKMIFPEAHPDYVKNPISLLNQQAKLDDLGATKFDVKTPFGKWAINKSDFEKQEIYNLINYGRVWLKSMHDNFISGPGWKTLPGFVKGWRFNELSWLPGHKTLDTWTEGRRVLPGLGAPIQLGRELGFGKTPYYAKGEDQSLTYSLKTLSWADSFFTEVSGNAWARAKVQQQLSEDIANGLVKAEDSGKEMIRRLDKTTSELFDPVTAGIDQKIVGYQIRDKQFQAFKDFVNLTEDVTGGSIGDMKAAIDTLKNSNSPALSAFATQLMPVTTSAFNWMKNVVRITSGFEAFRGAKDLARLGAKVTKDQVGKHLPAEIVETLRKSPVGVKWLEDAKQFESVYLHSDPIIRERAQQALGMTLGMYSAAFAIVWNLDEVGWETTGPMTHTYREGGDLKKPFHLRLEVPFMDFPGVEAVEMPFLYLGPFGGVLSLMTTARDLQQFGNVDTTTDIVTMGIAAQARQLMEIPTLTGPDKFTEAIAQAGKGDLKPIQRLFAESASKFGSPYLGYERLLSRGIFKSKSAAPLESILTPKYYKKGKAWDKAGNIGWGMASTAIGTLGYRFEDTGVGPMMNAIQDIFSSDSTYWEASRKARPFGRPGELVDWSDMPRLGYPLEALTGRFFPINSRVDDNPVNTARLDNLIPPVDRNVFSSENDGGVGLSETAVNELNHFLNEDALFKSPWTGETHVGIHAFILEIINRPEYKQLSGADVVSPYRTGNWDRKNSERADWIKSLIRNQINIVKWQWVDGEEYPNQIPDPEAPGGLRKQRWFADPELRELINSRKQD